MHTVTPPPSQKSFAVSVLASTAAFICVLSTLTEFLQASLTAASIFALHCALRRLTSFVRAPVWHDFATATAPLHADTHLSHRAGQFAPPGNGSIGEFVFAMSVATSTGD